MIEAGLAVPEPDNRLPSLRLDSFEALGRIEEVLAAIRAVVAVPPADSRDWFGWKSRVRRIARLTRDFGLSDIVHDRLYQAYPVPSMDVLAARDSFDISGEPLTDPEIAADGVILEFMPPRYDIDGLRHAEQAMWSLRTTFKEDRYSTHVFDVTDVLADRCHLHALPALGAYAGEVMVRAFKGTWIPGTTLLRHRVRVGERLIDPFALAWWTIYYGHPLDAQVESAVTGKAKRSVIPARAKR